MDPMTIRKALDVATGTSDYLIPELVDGAIRVGRIGLARRRRPTTAATVAFSAR